MQFWRRIFPYTAKTTARNERFEPNQSYSLEAARTISIVNQKGGCGKTTTAVNLGACLAQLKLRTLLLDMDPQANASLGLGREAGPESLYHVLTDPNVPVERIITTTDVAHLDLAPSNILLSGTEQMLVNRSRREHVLSKKLASVANRYRYIVIDCPPTLNLLTINALCASQYVVIPVQPHYYSLEGLKELLRTIHHVKDRFNPTLEVMGIVPTLFDQRVRVNVDMLEALRKHFREQVFEAVIPMNSKIIESQIHRQPVLQYSAGSPASVQYQALTREVVRHA